MNDTYHWMGGKPETADEFAGYFAQLPSDPPISEVAKNYAHALDMISDLIAQLRAAEVQS